MTETNEEKTTGATVQKTIEVMVPMRELAAMRLFAGSDETQMALCGVHLELADGRLILVATDGKQMGVLKSAATVPAGLQAAFTIPTLVLDRLWTVNECWVESTAGESAKINRVEPPEESTVNVTYYSGSGRVGLHWPDDASGLTISGRVGEEPYPIWRTTIPVGNRTQPMELCLNPRLLAKFGKAREVLGSRSDGIQLYGGDSTKPIEIRFLDNPAFYGLQMQVRNKERAENKIQPDWLTEGAKP